MLTIRKPKNEMIDRWLDEQRGRSLNYPEVGATRDRLPSAGYNVDRYSVRLGHGGTTYQHAVAAVRGLHMWDFNWLQLCWPTTPLETGSVLATLTWQLGVWFLSPCRIVYVIDEERPTRRFGFAYGTLEGHVERGEERFTVEWREDDSVWYEILAFSRPAHGLTKLGYPYMRWLQKRFGADSLRAMVTAVERGEKPLAAEQHAGHR